eukprot:1278403-Prymnesium_polylepis.1
MRNHRVQCTLRWRAEGAARLRRRHLALNEGVRNVHPQERIPLVLQRRWGCLRRVPNRSLAKHRMRNSSSIAERAHPSCLCLCAQPKRNSRQRQCYTAHSPRQMRVEHSQLCIWRALAALHAESQLDQASHACCWLCVSDIGLHAA